MLKMDIYHRKKHTNCQFLCGSSPADELHPPNQISLPLVNLVSIIMFTFLNPPPTWPGTPRMFSPCWAQRCGPEPGLCSSLRRWQSDNTSWPTTTVRSLRPAGSGMTVKLRARPTREQWNTWLLQYMLGEDWEVVYLYIILFYWH